MIKSAKQFSLPCEYRTYSDETLLDLLKQHDQQAFTEIYNRYWGFVYTHVYKMLQDDEETKDSIQEIFSKLWLKADQIKSNQNLAGLLFRSSRNHVLNLIEKNQVRRNYIQSLVNFVNTVDPNTVDLVDEKQLQLIIDREISNLPPKMREIFELSRKEELSHQEIAEKLNISYQTVKKQVQNALKIIKPKINHFGLILFFYFFN